LFEKKSVDFLDGIGRKRIEIEGIDKGFIVVG
jgi:hypothetical protein